MLDFKQVNEISGGYVETILNKLNINFVYEGGYYSIQCCFHGGDDYNLKYRNGFWYCFSQCRESYTMIDLVAKKLSITPLMACNWLCEALNIDTGTITLDKEKIAIRANLSHLRTMRLKRENIEYKQVSNELLTSIENYHHPYILEHYSHDTLDYFNIGYARYGDMQDRVCFPINSPQGVTISVSGRATNEHDKPRYKVLEESSKSETLYGIDKIADDDWVIVVEGFHGVLSLYEWGYKSVVAVMGSSLSDTQRRLLLGLGRRIIVIGDNDEAGERFAQQVYNKCYQFSKCTKLILSDITDVEKASPAEKDLGFDGMCELCERLGEMI